MNTLFAEALKRSVDFVFNDLPIKVLDKGNETDVFEWVRDFRRTYGRLPLFERAKATFPTFFSSLEETNEPIEFLFDQVLDRRRGEKASTILRNLADVVETKDPKSIEKELSSVKALYEPREKDMSSTKVSEKKSHKRSDSSLKFHVDVFDKVTKGLSGADYTVVVGRPGELKTTFGVWLAYNWLLEGRKIFFASLEMSYIDLQGKFLAFMGGFNSLHLRDLNEAPEQVDWLASVAEHRLHVGPGAVETPRRTPRTTETLFDLATRSAYDAIIVDGIYLMTGTDDYTGSRWSDVAGVSNRLKEGALKYNIPVIGISQLKRGSGKKGSRPDLDDIGYADAIGQDADFVISLQKESKKGNVRTSIATLLKNRYGVNRVGTALTMDFDEMEMVAGASFSYDDEDDE